MSQTKNTQNDRVSGLRRHSEEVNKLVVESLQGALIKLIGQKPYDSITVTELCRKAGVSRMAFYGNFQTKDDIFRRIVVDLHKEMMAQVGSPFRQPVSVKWYEDVFRFVSDKSDVLEPIFASGYSDKYLQLVNSMVMRYKATSQEQIYRRLVWTGGIINAVSHWLSNGKNVSPQQMALCCDKVFANIRAADFAECECEP